MTTNDLKHCPFCGTQDEEEMAVFTKSAQFPWDEEAHDICNVACSCGAYGPHAKSKDEAITRWNSRQRCFDITSLDEKKEKPYLCIVAWGLVMQSFGYYVDAQIRKARQDNAPEDAFCWDEDNNKWNVMNEDMKNVPCRREMESYLSVLKRETA